MGNDKTEIMGGATPAGAVASETKCPHCSAELATEEEFCHKCGYQRGTWQAVEGEQEAVQEREAAFELRGSSGQVWPVYEGENEIGRGEVAIQLDNPYASRLHARIVLAEDGSATIEDLGSSNGTLLRGEPVAANEPVPIKPGDEIKIGEEALVLQAIADSGTAPEEQTPDDKSAAEDEEISEEETPEAVDSAEAEAGETESEDVEDGEEEAVDEAEERQAAEGVAEMSPWSLMIKEGATHLLSLGETIVGRKEAEGGIAITDDGYISGRHCKLTATEDALRFEDLNSTNGSKVDGELITPGEPVELAAGSEITLGQTEITVVYSPLEEPADVGEAETEVPEEESGS